jgi:hypothetical protein
MENKKKFFFKKEEVELKDLLRTSLKTNYFSSNQFS